MSLPNALCFVSLVSLLLAALWRKLERQRSPEVLPAAPCLQHLDRARMDLRPLLADMSRSCGETLQAASIGLEQGLPAESLMIWADARELRQMLSEIVQIARHSMPRGGILKVNARAESGQAAVSFVDSSLASEQPQLASTFDRLRGARQNVNCEDSEARASVILANRIVSSHGGRLYAAPSPLGGLGLTWRMPLMAQGAAVHQRAVRHDGLTLMIETAGYKLAASAITSDSVTSANTVDNATLAVTSASAVR